MLEKADVRELLHRLTGQSMPFQDSSALKALELAEGLLATCGMGHSQFNELLLLLGYDRVTSAFFYFLVNITDLQSEEQVACIENLQHFRAIVERFVEIALQQHGNVKYAFKSISSMDEDALQQVVTRMTPIPESHYLNRHEPILPLQEIPGKDTYYLGYVVAKELEAKAKADPEDSDVKAAVAKLKKVIDIGLHNQIAYLTSDHMDVYVATSMRERHEYYLVNHFTSRIFGHDRLKKLKPRYFDPTQAYCQDRIDKGLSEALMLRRAKCTLYFVQETDTLGKDSELASTLAQGKPVVAFVPQVGDQDGVTVPQILAVARELYPEKDERVLLLDQLRLFEPGAAWSDPEVRAWIADPGSMDTGMGLKRLLKAVRQNYDKRAEVLRDVHPLGIQVNLDTGVANGVIVARTVQQCADVLYSILTNQVKFALEQKAGPAGREYIILKEAITQSVFRVVTGDPLLTNSFWNHYLKGQ